MSNILDRNITDTYKGKQRVNKTVRVNKDTALKLDKFLDYCRENKGAKVSQNQLLEGIILYFITDYEDRVTKNPEKANKRVISLVTGHIF